VAGWAGAGDGGGGGVLAMTMTICSRGSVRVSKSLLAFSART